MPMVHRTLDGTIVRVVVAPPAAPRRRRYLATFLKSGMRWGIRVGAVSTPVASFILYNLSPAVQNGELSFLRSILTSGALGVGVGVMLGLAAWVLVDSGNILRLLWMIRRGRVLQIHPLLLKLWQEEIARSGVSLSTEEFNREIDERYSLFWELTDQAVAACDERTNLHLRQSLRDSLRKRFAEEGQVLKAAYAPRDSARALEAEAYNEGLRIRFGLPPAE